MSKRKDKAYVATIRPIPRNPEKGHEVITKVRAAYNSAGIYHVRTFTLMSNGAVHCSDTKTGLGRKYFHIGNPANRHEQYVMGLLVRERYEIVEIVTKPGKALKSGAGRRPNGQPAQKRAKTTHSHGPLEGFKNDNCPICDGTLASTCEARGYDCCEKLTDDEHYQRYGLLSQMMPESIR